MVGSLSSSRTVAGTLGLSTVEPRAGGVVAPLPRGILSVSTSLILELPLVLRVAPPPEQSAPLRVMVAAARNADADCVPFNARVAIAAGLLWCPVRHRTD